MKTAKTPQTVTQSSVILGADGKPIRQEIASTKRDLIYSSYNLLPEGDKLAQAKGAGQGVGIYDQLKTETVVKDKLGRRVLGLVSKPWEVTAGGDGAQDIAASEYIDALLDRIEFDQLCKRLDFEAILKGRAIEEIMWGNVDGKVEPIAIIPRKVTRFQYDTDGQLRLRVPENITLGELLPPNKFIVHTVDATDDNPYGMGLGATLWWPVFFKRKGISFWLTFADKFGNPTSIGKYPAGTSPADQDKLLGVMLTISQDTGIVIPEGQEVALLEATRSGIDTYERLCRYMDEMISRAIVHESDSARDAGGAMKAAADSKAEVRSDLLQADSDLLTITITRDLVRPIVEWNFPGAKVPRVWRNFEPPADKKLQVEIDEKLHGMGYAPKDPEKYISETYGGDWIKAAPKDTGTTDPTANFMTKLKAAAAQKQLPPPATEFAEGEAVPDPAANIINQALTAAEPALLALMAPIRNLVANSNSFEEVLNGMAALYSDLPSDQFAEVMELAIHVADLGGRYEIQQAVIES